MSTAPKSKRARRMWAIEYDLVNLSRSIRQHMLCVRHTQSECREEWDTNTSYPVFVLPPDPESQEGYVEAMAISMACCDEAHWKKLLEPTQQAFRDSARAALAALMKGRTGAPRRA